LWVIITLVSLIVFIILVLCIPLDLNFYVNISENPKLKGRLIWLFGLIDRELKKAEVKSEKKEKPVKDKQKPQQRISARTIYQILRTKGLFSQLRKLVVDIFRSFRVKELAANIKLGLENPADTAMLFAVTGTLNSLLSLLPYQINIQPSFDGDITFEAYLQGATRLWPILLMLALLKFLFSLPALRIVRTLVRII
jgi:hypothetical protein